MPPNLEWTRVETQWRETTYKAKVDRRKDYYWRIRACNEVGMTEPSMPASLRKAEGVDLCLPLPILYLDIKNLSIVFLVTLDDDVNVRSRRRSWSRDVTPSSRSVPSHLRVAPVFIGKPATTQYGVEGRTCRIVASVRAYPEPTVVWSRGGSVLSAGEKYNMSISASGV